MYIIVGLGNPGKKYENTRHNIGFIAVDQLAEKNNINITKIKHKALVGEGRISGQKVLLVKPQTYMNLSGNSVREVMEYYKVDVENLIVIYDDIDLDAGVLRIRKKGSAGTHNGMKSVIYDLKSDRFPRIRIGIGSSGNMDLANYVIGGFTKGEKTLLEDVVTNGVLAAESIIKDGIEKAMNAYNIKSKPAGEGENDS
ncbi:MAG: aminoacyl-tRNA hydrolase [Anaerovoracaceae bacterium]